jgi:uncharacterized protein
VERTDARAWLSVEPASGDARSLPFLRLLAKLFGITYVDKKPWFIVHYTNTGRPFMTETPLQRKPATIQQTAGFDPFRDRVSRAVRNSLSRAFGQCLENGSLSAVEERCGSLLKTDLSPCCRDYVESRLGRYRRAFERIQESRNDPVLRGLILWDLRLFFEMHEVLEHAWHHAEGSRKGLLQSLIRAAGVYIKLEHGYDREAARLAEKACAVLERSSSALRDYCEPEALVAALKSLDPDPPVLLAASPPPHSVSLP